MTSHTYAQDTLSLDPLPIDTLSAGANANSSSPNTRQDLQQGLEDRKWYPATGRDLLALVEDCEDASCMSFVSGAMTGLAAREFMFGKDSPFCAGDTIPVQDIRDALVTVIGSDEELQRMPVAFGILATFSATWPCNTQQDPLAQNTQEQLSVEDGKKLQAGSVKTVMENSPPALTYGNEVAPVVQTLIVFHDPNCQHCEEFKRETQLLSETGWKIHVLPVGILGENSVAFSAVMYALSQRYPMVTQALYEQASAGSADVESALKIAAANGINAPEVLSLLTQTGAYDQVRANMDMMDALGAQGTPSWLLSDYLFTGSAPANQIQNISGDVVPPPGEAGLVRPGAQQTQSSNSEQLVLPEDN